MQELGRLDTRDRLRRVKQRHTREPSLEVFRRRREGGVERVIEVVVLDEPASSIAALQFEQRTVEIRTYSVGWPAR